MQPTAAKTQMETGGDKSAQSLGRVSDPWASFPQAHRFRNCYLAIGPGRDGEQQQQRQTRCPGSPHVVEVSDPLKAGQKRLVDASSERKQRGECRKIEHARYLAAGRSAAPATVKCLFSRSAARSELSLPRAQLALYLHQPWLLARQRLARRCNLPPKLQHTLLLRERRRRTSARRWRCRQAGQGGLHRRAAR